ncbi:hypothetical protein QAD02_024431 [Eretmocerus hayati]|uniref:Uncharacterized protein n=1 Tax=Eretmocerus hayati TaxID=131215 RepID=A0ACC2Q0C1_9HYME|nr:hypothetical protein QAD02_024431 [Eretmocerus hayati]
MLNRIDGELLPIKAHYFFFNAATGPMMQFLPTIAKQMHFSPSLVGKIFMILPISGLIAKPLFGGLADKFGLHKTFFIFFQVILAIAFYSINFIPASDYSAQTNLTCNMHSYLELASDNAISRQDIENIASVPSDDVSSCSLSCTIRTVSDVKALCNSWNITKYCDLAKKITANDVGNLDKLEFEAYFNNSHDLPLEQKSLNLRISNASFSDGQVYTTLCRSFSLRIPCQARCPKVPFLDQLIKDISSSQKPQLPAESFRWFLSASIISWIGMAVVVSIADAICFDLLGYERNKDYGKQKMWGSIGTGIFGLSIGYLIDVFSQGDGLKNYAIIFYVLLLAMFLDVVVSSTLKKSNLKVHNEPSIFYELWPILRESRVLVFAWWCIGAGMCTGVVWNFLFWYTEEISLSPSDKAWLKTLQGLLTGIQCFLGEMPFNFICGDILRKIGHINVMSLVLLVYAIRFMAYSMITNPWLIIVVEILHGPSMGLCWPTMVSYGDKVAPSGTKATTQGFIGAVFEGIGVSLGSLICGYLIDVHKGVTTFRIFSAGALVWLSLFWILQLILQRVKAYPLQQGHTHLMSYAPPDDDSIHMTMCQEMQTY